MQNPHTPPKGWTIASGKLEPDRTIAGYAARNQDVKGRCYLRDCRRNCHVDHRRIVENGLGALRIDQVKLSMRCQRLDACGLTWEEERRREAITLRYLFGRPAVVVRIACRLCQTKIDVAPEAMAARLTAEQKGDGATPVQDLPDLLTAPCKACGKAAWETAIVWPNPASWGGRRMIDMAGRGKPQPLPDPLKF